MTPGPAVLFVVAHALRYGARRALPANLGVLSANAFYFALSALGLGAAFLASGDLYRGIRFAGAAYLVYLGAATLLGRGLAVRGARAPEIAEAPGASVFARAFLVQATNPKSLLFFTALLPQFIRPERPVPLQVFILGATSIAVEFLVLGTYGLLAGRASRVATSARFATVANRAIGLLLIGAAAGLTLARIR